MGKVTPKELRSLKFPAGAMGPKVDVACQFVEKNGKRAAIGALAMLTMLAEAMLPEAFEHGGKLVGIITVLGFC